MYSRLHIGVECPYCGILFQVEFTNWRSGHTRSCGCLNRKLLPERARKMSLNNWTHGHGRRGQQSLTYVSWASMFQRCTNPKATNYKNWGGRGIKVCERWRKFKNFLKDLGPRLKGTSLDRINNEGDYEPSNCRWATPKQQHANTRATSKSFL